MDVAKQLITRFYAKPIKHNYFMGCSNGGREAMIAAMRFPTEFDGVIAGSLAFCVLRSVLAEVWDNRVLLVAAPKDAKGNPILATPRPSKILMWWQKACCSVAINSMAWQMGWFMRGSAAIFALRWLKYDRKRESRAT